MLTDFFAKPHLVQCEAIQILSYPEKLADLARSELFLAEKIRSILISPRPSGEFTFCRRVPVSRRRYFCRAFVVDSGAKELFAEHSDASRKRTFRIGPVVASVRAISS